jgi:hypothetical protein
MQVGILRTHICVVKKNSWQQQIKSALSPFARPKTEPKANAILFLEEQVASVQGFGAPGRLCKLSHFFLVIVLVRNQLLGTG